MKKSLLILSLVFAFSQVISQTAEIYFINNSTATTAANLDVEVVNKSTTAVYATYSSIATNKSTGIVSVPAGVIVTINFKVAGSSTIFYTLDNQVFDTNDFDIMMLYGSSTSKRFSTFTGHKSSSSSSKIKFDFAHATSTLQEIDLTVRETNVVLADNFTYGDKTFTFDDEFTAATSTLDMTPFNSSVGLYAYTLPGSTLGGEYIVLYTSGTDMYMAQMNGTVTKLTKTTATTGSNAVGSVENDAISLYPNPSSSAINFSGVEGLQLSATIYDLNGRAVISSTDVVQGVDVSALENGIYVVRLVDGKGNSFVQNFVKN